MYINPIITIDYAFVHATSCDVQITLHHVQRHCETKKILIRLYSEHLHVHIGLYFAGLFGNDRNQFF